MEEKTCSICCEDVTNVIVCEFCKIKMDICIECSRRYLLESIQDAHCMSCKTFWTPKTMYEFFGAGFISGDYRKTRKNLLFAREKALLPATVDAANRRKKVVALRRKITKLQTKDLVKVANNIKEREKILQKILDLRGELAALHGQLPEEEVVCPYVFGCAQNNCKGFVDINTYQCGICSIQHCKKCNEIKDEEHKCNKENIKSAVLIMKSTKPCPNCAVRVYKIEGCNQMWCTSCNKAFDWATLKIVEGPIHNPHYAEFVRAGGIRAPNIYNGQDIEQNNGGCILPDIYLTFNNSYEFDSPDEISIIFSYYRLTAEMREGLEYLREKLQREQFEDIRIRYLLNEIKEEQFKKEIFIKERIMERIRSTFQITEPLYNVLKDIFIDFNSRMILLRNKYSKNLILNGIPNKTHLIPIYKSEFKRLAKIFNDKIQAVVKLGQQAYKDDSKYLLYKAYVKLENGRFILPSHISFMGRNGPHYRIANIH